MLRITQLSPSDTGATLKLEGKLVGPWVAELQQICRQLGAVKLDLSAVTFVDNAGLSLLRDVLGQGASLASCSGLVAELLHGESQ